MAKKGTWTEKISPAMHTVLWPLKVEKDLDHDRWTILGGQFELRNFEIIKELLNEGFFMNECFSNFQVFEVSLSEERYLTQLASCSFRATQSASSPPGHRAVLTDQRH